MIPNFQTEGFILFANKLWSKHANEQYTQLAGENKILKPGILFFKFVSFIPLSSRFDARNLHYMLPLTASVLVWHITMKLIFIHNLFI